MKLNDIRALFLLIALSTTAFAQKPAVTTNVETNLRKHVEYLASEKLEGRRAGEPGATAAATYIASQFAKLRLRPVNGGVKGYPGYLQAFSYTPVRDPHSTSTEPTRASTTDGRATSNVIGILPGNDPVLKNEAIVIGAHYDHLGKGGRGSLAANSTEIHHGADDNASGTAAVIELARQFAKEKKNKRTIIFMAFSGEEDGLFGSKFYVNNPVWPLDKTVAMINLDMVGRLKDDKLNVGGIGTAQGWRELIDGQNFKGTNRIIPVNSNGAHAENILPSFSLLLNEDGFGPSDHSSFYGKQIPVLFFFTGTHLDYHKPTDTFEKINYDGLTKIAHYVSAIAKSIDENAARPTYKTAPSSGTPGGRMGFNVSLGTIPSYADTTDGLVLDGVRDNSPASKAGLKAGDKIVKLAGKDVRNAMDYTSVLGTMKAGDEYEVIIKRGAETLTLKIVPAAAARRP